MDTRGLVEAIDDRIKKAGLTRHGLSVVAAIPWVTLRRRMANPADLRLGELYRVANALGTTPDGLIADGKRRDRANKAAA